MSTLTSELPSSLAEIATLVRRDEPLSRHATMRVGGPARWWVEPQNETDLTAALRAIHGGGLRLQVLGAGSNLVPDEAGYDGVVLCLGKGFGWHRVEADLLIAGGAAKLPKLAHVANEHALGNFEWACGIPGSVGGSVWGNAGARGFNGHDFESRDAAADLQSLIAYDRAGERHELQRHEIEFAYRRSSLGELVVVEATFRLKPLNAEAKQRHKTALRDLLAKRRATQPVNAASAGCVWKNPHVEGCAGAGALIEQLGLKGWREGDAEVSTTHGNFVINRGHATGDEVRRLIARVEEKVLAATGIQLEREARLLSA